MSFSPDKSQLSFVEGGKSSESAEGCVVPRYSNFLLGFEAIQKLGQCFGPLDTAD